MDAFDAARQLRESAARYRRTEINPALRRGGPVGQAHTGFVESQGKGLYSVAAILDAEADLIERRAQAEAGAVGSSAA